MPQMAPYSWLILFLMFNFIFIFFSSYLNFFYFFYKALPPLKKTFYTWMW